MARTMVRSFHSSPLARYRDHALRSKRQRYADRCGISTHETAIWERMCRLYSPSNPAAQHWWNTAGRALALLLFHGGYSTDAQVDNLRFFATMIVHELGTVLHRQWNSFMTDDGSPLELSWDWGTGRAKPQVRVAIEPVGLNAGTNLDPENRTSGLIFLQQLSRGSDTVNNVWLNRLAQELRVFDAEPLSPTDVAAHSSRCFTGFNLREDGLDVKAYLRIMSMYSNRNDPSLIALDRAIKSLPGIDSMRLDAFQVFRQYVQRSTQHNDIAVEGLSVDWIDPVKARIKIYLRSNSMNFDSAVELMTLDGRLQSPILTRGFADLRYLWNLLFEGASGELPETLSDEAPKTAGLIYNFELRHGVGVPVPKVYLPVRHHCRSDAHVMEALRKYFRRSHSNSVEHYSAAMDAIFSPTYLREGTGVQTYISCSFGTDGLKLVSYINPQSHKLRW